jgi:hypothetical protein
LLIASQGLHSLVLRQMKALLQELRRGTPIELLVHIYREIAQMLKAGESGLQEGQREPRPQETLRESVGFGRYLLAWRLTYQPARM